MHSEDSTSALIQLLEGHVLDSVVVGTDQCVGEDGNEVLNIEDQLFHTNCNMECVGRIRLIQKIRGVRRR